MSDVIDRMMKDPTLLAKFQIIRLIRNDILNTHLLHSMKRIKKKLFEEYTKFDNNLIVLETMGFSAQLIEKGELLEWYSNEVDLICGAYVGKPKFELHALAAKLYMQLDKMPKK